eukprot:4829784-Pleurochrysis_carterae.AAC.2
MDVEDEGPMSDLLNVSQDPAARQARDAIADWLHRAPGRDFYAGRGACAIPALAGPRLRQAAHARWSSHCRQGRFSPGA